MILEARAILDTDKIRALTRRFSRLEVEVNGNIHMEFLCGASLANHGLLSSVKLLKLKDVDLSPVPAQHLASLVSYVPSHLSIENVSGCDLVSILTCIKCYELHIHRQSLGKEETQALVQAMESRVVKVRLGSEVTLDIEALTEYSASGGKGVCREMVLVDDTAARYEEELRNWARRTWAARSRNWRVTRDEVRILVKPYTKSKSINGTLLELLE